MRSALVDPDFAKQQLDLMLRERYMHPNGQIPAYEWNFGDVNPPVHAWATIFTLPIEKQRSAARATSDFLEAIFHKLLLNFTWWVNRKDRYGRNVFEGGFLGLDNIGVFDRSAPLPTGGIWSRPTARPGWPRLPEHAGDRCRIGADRPGYEDMAVKFLEHFLWIGSVIHGLGRRDGMWDEEDGFFYDLLRLPDGREPAQGSLDGRPAAVLRLRRGGAS